MDPAGKKRDEIVVSLELKRNADLLRNTTTKRLGVHPLLMLCPSFEIRKPNAVNDGVKNIPPVLLRFLNGGEQKVAGPRTNRFMRFNPTETGISITRVTKTRDQQPLERILPQVKGVAFVLTLLFQLTSSLNDGGHDTPEKSVRSPTGVHVEPRYGKRLLVCQREEAVAETSVNRTLTKFISRLFRVKRDNAACGD